MQRVSVRVPGSSANLGSGFDSLAVALDCWLQVDARRRGDGEFVADGAPDLLGGDNLVVDAMRIAARTFDLALPGCDVSVVSAIPVARGLGSSAAAIVAGIVAAGYLSGAPLSDAQVIDLGGALEGHADNISASVLGGITVSVKTSHGWLADSIGADAPWQPVVFVPGDHAFTSEARAILPSMAPMADVVANVGRSALLVHALHAGRGDLLAEAMRDRLHQPYRATIFRHLNACIEAARDAGAAGAALSGAGPAVLALAADDCREAVARAMEDAARTVGVEGESCCFAIPQRGVSVSID